MVPEMSVLLLRLAGFLVGCVLGRVFGPALIRALGRRARVKRLDSYVARRAPELRLEHEVERRLLAAHDADKERGGVYRGRGNDPDA